MFSRSTIIGRRVLQIRARNPTLWQKVLGFRHYTNLCNLEDFTRSPPSYDDMIFYGQYSRRLPIQVCLHDYDNGIVCGYLYEGDSSLGWNWKAPEQLLGGNLSVAIDLFTLGFIICYCITGGIHPFGKDLRQRDKNIIENNPVNMSWLEDMAEAFHLVSHLLNPEPELR